MSKRSESGPPFPVPTSFHEGPVVRMRPTEGEVAMHAERHQPEPGGCTCGFCAWSGEHVAIMAYREACEAIGIRL